MRALVFDTLAEATAAAEVLFDAGATVAAGRGWTRDAGGRLVSRRWDGANAPEAPRVGEYPRPRPETQGRWAVQHPATHAAMRSLPEAERSAMLGLLEAEVLGRGLPWVEDDVTPMAAEV